jgi:hypothetical protein
MSGILLYARLAVATAVVLAPGFVVARALGVRGVAAGLSWALALVFAASAVMFAVHASLTLTLALVLAVGVVLAPAALRRRPGHRIPGSLGVLAGGVFVGILLWFVAGEIGGDGLFHLGRVRKLDDFGDLSLASVGEFADGGLHPGYAFPLWHVFLALVARVAFVDPADVVLHLPSVLAPIALLVAYEAGWALFRRRGAALSAVGASLGIAALAPGHAGAYTALALPATASRQLLVPAALALALAAVRNPARSLIASAGVANFAVAVVHPTYAIFLWIPFAGFLAVRWAWTREDVRSGSLALAALVVPASAFFVWLLPTVRKTESVGPDAAERSRALEQYAGQLDVSSPSHFHLSPEVFVRSGAVAVAALLGIGLAAFAPRRRWSALVVGGALAVFLITLVPWLFVPFSDLVSVSQARRLAGFLPFAFAFAGAAGVLAGLLRIWALPVALVGGTILQIAYPGDFEYSLTPGGPAWATWIGVAGALVALVVGFRGRASLERRGAIVAAAFLLPVAVHGLAHWTTDPARTPSPLTPGLLAAVRASVPEAGIVFSDLESSYRLTAFTHVYVCNAPPSHVADTTENRPYVRRKDAIRFFRTGDLAIPEACGAGWLVLDRKRFDPPGARGTILYRDGRYTLYALERP